MAVELSAAILCDFAQVRGGVLFVASGGVARLHARSLPAPMALYLGLMFEVTPDSLGRSFAVNVTIANATTAEVTGTVSTRVGAQRADLLPGENLMYPLAVDLRPMPVRVNGPHDLRVSIDGELARFLTVHVLPAPQGPVAAAPPSGDDPPS